MTTFPDAFLAKLRAAEGFFAHPYWDYKQSTIGYGTRAKPGETSISREDAERRLQEELAKARAMVDSRFPGLPENKALALTDLTYNAGSKWMDAGLGQAVASNNDPDAIRLLLQYVNAGGKPLPGLVERRGWNADLYSGRMALGGPESNSGQQTYDPATGQLGPPPLAMVTGAGREIAPSEPAPAQPFITTVEAAPSSAGEAMTTFGNRLGAALSKLPQAQAPNVNLPQMRGPANLMNWLTALEKRRKGASYGIG